MENAADDEAAEDRGTDADVDVDATTVDATDAEDIPVEATTDVAATTLLDPTVATPFPPTVTATTFFTAASAATITIACVFPVGKSGWKDASTTNKLSVP
jgi:hypothetical protein